MERRPAIPAEVAPHLEALARLADRHGIDLLVLFGSRVQGRAREQSDVDIGVLLAPEAADGTPLRTLSRDLQKVLGTSRVDVAILNRASALLQYQVARTGVPLVERRRGTFAGFCVRSIQRHNDARDFYAAEDEYLRRRFGLPPAAARRGPKEDQHG